MGGFITTGEGVDEWQLLRGRIAFDGTSGKGAQGTVTIADPTGVVEIKTPIVHCSESLAGATATLALGFASNSSFFASATATDIDAGQINDPSGGYQADAAAFGGNNGPESYAMVGNLILTVGTADITDGQLDFFIFWRPLSSDGALALGANMVAI